MDPNANLEELRELIALNANRPDGARDLRPDEVDRLCELVEALDDWLSKGGFLPSAWERGNDPAGYPFARQTGAKP